jgi:hypothetical protein
MAPTDAARTTDRWRNAPFADFLRDYDYRPKLNDRDALFLDMRTTFDDDAHRQLLLTTATALGCEFRTKMLSYTYSDGRHFLSEMSYLTVDQVTEALEAAGEPLNAFQPRIAALLTSERADNISANVDAAAETVELTKVLRNKLAPYEVDVDAIVHTLVANKFATKKHVQMLATTGMWNKSGCDSFQQVALTAAFQKDGQQHHRGDHC